MIGTWENPCCEAWDWIDGCVAHSPVNTQITGVLNANVERYQLLGLCTIDRETALRLREEIASTVAEQAKDPRRVIQSTVET